MTADKALYAFFAGFGLPAYAGGVPDGAEMPYLTYEPAFASWGGQASIAVSLWYYTKEEETPNRKAREVAQTIGPGGVVLGCEGGSVWLKRGSPWCTSPETGDDPKLKRRYLNVAAEYFTQD